MKVGRILQAIALLILPLGMILEFNSHLGYTFGVNHLVFLIAFAVLLFLTGRYLEGYGG